MRIIKWIGLALALVVVLAVGGIAVFLATVDFSEYRDSIAAELKALTGREVRIAGKIDAELLSGNPSVVVHDIAIANTPWGTRKEMVRLERLEVEIELLPLITGKLSVRRLVAHGADILLETDEKGQRNWTFATDWLKAQAPDKEPAFKLLAVGEIALESARVAYRDGTTGGLDEFSLMRFSARGTRLEAPLAFQAAGIADGKPVNVKGELGSLKDFLEGRAATVQFAASVGPSDFSGRLVVQAGEKIAIKGALASERVEIEAAGRKASQGRLFADNPMPMGLIRVVTADVAYKAKTMIVGGSPLANVVASVRIANSELTLKPVTADIAGGHLAGEITLNATTRPAAFAANLSLRGLSLAQLNPTVTGPMEVDLQVTSTGDSPRAIAAGLNGYVAVIGGPGRVRDQSLALLTFGIGTIEKVLTTGSLRSEAVNCVVAGFEFTKGIGRSRVLLIDSPRLSFVGSGVVNLHNETMDLLFVPATKDLVGVGDVAIHPVRMRGHLLRPAITVDPSEAAKEAAKNIVGVAERSINFVGSLFGVTSGPKRSGSSCGAAISRAKGRAAAAPVRNTTQPSTRAPAPRRERNLFQRLNPFD